MTSQGPGGSGNVADKMKDATQPGDSKTTTEKLSETVQQGMESAKKAGSGAMESAQDAAAKISESASGALGGGKK